jgi:outer membrane protein OmpA-like peptidoglycan-associated protein
VKIDLALEYSMGKSEHSTVKRFLFLLFLSIICCGTHADTAAECPSQADDLFARAQNEQARGGLTEARSLFEQAANLCDQAGFWQALGEALTLDDTGSGSSHSDGAIDAFGKALDAARRDRDAAAGGTAARAIVKQGLLAGDPIKANSWLLTARQIDPNASELPGLQSEVDLAMAVLTPEEIEIGFSGTRGAGRANSLLHGNTGPSHYWKEQPPQDPTVSALEVDPLAQDSGSGGAGVALSTISIPIRFESNSSSVTAETASNLESLANVLAGRPESTNITLIGYADLRGDSYYNLRLSQQRADKIREILEILAPSLRGRIKTIGRGEAEPVDFGTSERAHANNRRLEISLSS